MLVLSRQKDESIVIGDDIEITVVDIRGNKVRLGIAAPKKIPVNRKEVWEAIQRKKAADAAAAKAQQEKKCSLKDQVTAQGNKSKRRRKGPQKM